MTDVFISYKREERSTAKALAEALQRHGFSVWWDVELLPGQRYRREILRILKASRSAIVIWSQASVESDFVLDEAQHARDLDILVPVRIDDCTLPLGYGQLQTLDLRAWNRDPGSPDLQALLVVLRGRVPVEPAPEQPAAADPAEEEARYWRRLSEQSRASPADYQGYLLRFGDHALFAEDARARLAALQAERAAPRRWLALGGGVGLLAAAGAWWWLGAAPPSTAPSAAAPQATAASAASTGPMPSGPAIAAAASTPEAGVAGAADVASAGERAPAPPRPAVARAKVTEPGAARTERADPPQRTATPTGADLPTGVAPASVRDAEISVRFAAADQGRADAVLRWLATKNVRASSARLYAVPSSVANRIYFTPDFVQAAEWLRSGLKGTADLELQPFDARDADERRQIRIVIGP